MLFTVLMPWYSFRYSLMSQIWWSDRSHRRFLYTLLIDQRGWKPVCTFYSQGSVTQVICIALLSGNLYICIKKIVEGISAESSFSWRFGGRYHGPVVELVAKTLRLGDQGLKPTSSIQHQDSHLPHVGPWAKPFYPSSHALQGHYLWGCICALTPAVEYEIWDMQIE